MRTARWSRCGSTKSGRASCARARPPGARRASLRHASHAVSRRAARFPGAGCGAAPLCERPRLRARRYNNPQETYQYFDLPFCKPLGFQKVKKREGLGEVLGGNELVDSKMKIQYKTNTASQSICQMVIDPSVEKQFVEAVRTSYWYQVFLDDLPQWGMVGEWIADDPAHRDGTGRALIYTHKNIDIGSAQSPIFIRASAGASLALLTQWFNPGSLYRRGKRTLRAACQPRQEERAPKSVRNPDSRRYDGRRIVQVNLTSESPKEVKQGTHFDLTYSVEWKEMRGPSTSLLRPDSSQLSQCLLERASELRGARAWGANLAANARRVRARRLNAARSAPVLPQA